MNEDLFKPTLNEEDNIPVKVYDINKLFYVAFFGGMIPLMVLGNINAGFLKVEKKLRNLLLLLGIIFIISKIVVVSLYSIRFIQIDARYIRWTYRILSVLIFLGYYGVMKKKYSQHIMFGGENKPLLKDAILWIVLGSAIEFALMFIGRQFINV